MLRHVFSEVTKRRLNLHLTPTKVSNKGGAFPFIVEHLAFKANLKRLQDFALKLLQVIRSATPLK